MLSGPTPTRSTRSGPSASSSGDGRRRSPARRVHTSTMFASGSRRRANASALADETSSHWRSSIASSRASSARRRARSRPRPRALADRPAGPSVLEEERDLERPAPRRRQPGRTSSITPSRRSPRPAYGSTRSDSSGRAMRTRRPVPGRVDRSAPKGRLADPRLAFERDRARAGAVVGALEKAEQRAELLVPSDKVDRHPLDRPDRRRSEQAAPAKPAERCGRTYGLPAPPRTRATSPAARELSAHGGVRRIRMAALELVRIDGRS